MKKYIALLLALVLCLGACSADAQSGDALYTQLGLDAIPAVLGERTLDQQALNALKGADEGTLRSRISTFADYVAWVDSLYAPYYGFTTSNDMDRLTMGGGFTFPWMSSMLGANMLADQAWRLLSDDYPGMKMVMAVMYAYNQRIVLFANAIPVEGGYVVLGADTFARCALNSSASLHTVEPLLVESLEHLIPYFQTAKLIHADGFHLAQLMAFDTDQTIHFNLDGKLYVPSIADAVTILFEDQNAAMPEANSAPILQRYNTSFPWNGSAINDAQTAAAIRQGSLENAAKSIRSLQDMMNYVYYSGYVCGDGDISLPARNNLRWHFNYKPAVVFERHTGCCGATSGLVAHLLEGDYDQVGFIGITYQEGLGGGHVINYVLTNGTYYLFDVFAWGQSGFGEWGLRLTEGATLAEAARRWADQTGGVKLMYGYTNAALGDAPVGWKDDNWGVSYLIRDYAQDVQILLETPEEGYVYEFIDIPPTLLQGIELIRSSW